MGCWVVLCEARGVFTFVLVCCFHFMISFFLCSHQLCCHSFSSFLHSTVILSLFYSWFYSVVILSFLLLEVLPLFLFIIQWSFYLLFHSFLLLVFCILVKVRTTQVGAWWSFREKARPWEKVIAIFSCHSFSSFLHSTVILSLFYSWFYSVVILSFLLLPFFLFIIQWPFYLLFHSLLLVFCILVKVRTTQVGAWWSFREKARPWPK